MSDQIKTTTIDQLPEETSTNGFWILGYNATRGVGKRTVRFAFDKIQKLFGVSNKLGISTTTAPSESLVRNLITDFSAALAKSTMVVPRFNLCYDLARATIFKDASSVATTEKAKVDGIDGLIIDLQSVVSYVLLRVPIPDLCLVDLQSKYSFQMKTKLISGAGSFSSVQLASHSNTNVAIWFIAGNFTNDLTLISKNGSNVSGTYDASLKNTYLTIAFTGSGKFFIGDLKVEINDVISPYTPSVIEASTYAFNKSI